MDKRADVAPPGPDPHASPRAALDRLWDTVAARRGASAEASYTARLLAGFPALPARKLAEEATECVIEAVAGDREALVRESADLLYHLVVLLVGAGLAREQVFGELAAREVQALRRDAARGRARRKARAPLGRTSKIP